MATYAVGDIQGCLEPLQTLLVKTQFNPQRDRLWVAGDMINRGPESLKALRFLYHLRHCLKVVLGNHDLHLLAVASGHRKPSSSDTLKAIMEASDRDILLEWIRQQPLIHHDANLGYTMVHAGIPPQWTLQKALKRAREVEAVLRSDGIHRYLKSMYGNEPRGWRKGLTAEERWRVITNYFTRMRFCTAEGELDLAAKSGAHQGPDGYQPWYAHSNRKTHDDNIIFGHWAALEGKADHEKVFAIDTGYVWGGKLTMMRLEDRKHFSTANNGA